MLKFFRKIRTLSKLKRKIIIFIPEVALTLAFARFILLFFSFKKITNYLGEISTESSFDERNSLYDLEDFSVVIPMVAKNVPWEATCFVQAIAGRLMLNRRKINSTIYIGVKQSAREKGEILGHAWLRSGNIIITGRKGFEDYKVITFFS